MYVWNFAPVLDVNGIIFSDGGSTELNIWGNGPGNYSFWLFNPATGYTSLFDGEATVSASVVPEPGSLALAGMGVFGLLGYRARRRVKANV